MICSLVIGLKGSLVRGSGAESGPFSGSTAGILETECATTRNEERDDLEYKRLSEVISNAGGSKVESLNDLQSAMNRVAPPNIYFA